MELCKTPELARQVTMGPIDAFDFDAAILFSDLLFPLEQLGLGLEYNPGPQLARHINQDNIGLFKAEFCAQNFYRFQEQAIRLLRQCLPQQKSLLGFVGAPFTLYTYAVEGGHSGPLVQAKRGLYNGLYQQFLALLLPQLTQSMIMQARGGADALCLFDTAAGELSLRDFKCFVLPSLRQITRAFKQQCPGTQVIYYSKQTHLDYLLAIEDDNIDVLGFDWRVDIRAAFEQLAGDYYLQGNIDPAWMLLPWSDCQQNLQQFVQGVEERYWERWIFGLGHGVLKQTPESHVQKTVQFLHHYFR